MKIYSVYDPEFAACNKWLLPHSDSDEVKNGAKVGLKGENIDSHHFYEK